MRIISVRISDEEHASLLRRAGKGRGALSHYIRRQLKEPASAVTVSMAAPTTTGGQAFIEWMTGLVGPNLNLRTL